MKKKLAMLLMAAALASLTACAGRGYYYGPPAPHAYWVPGHWEGGPYGGRYWVRGHWR